jgi:hypothetical protein
LRSISATRPTTSGSVTITGTTFVPGTVRRLHDTTYYPGFTTRGLNRRGYDVSPDGQRFLMIKSREEADEAKAEMTVAINWLPDR